MYCTNCGKEIPDGSTFCNHCGTALKTTQDQQRPAQPQSGAAFPSVSLPPSYQTPMPAQPIKQRKHWYARWWVWVILGFVSTAFFVSIVNNAGTVKPVSSYSNQVVSKPKSTTAPADVDSATAAPATEAPVTEVPATEAPPTEAPVEEENLVIYDANGITITYKGIETDWLGTEVKLLIENNTNTDYCIQTRDMSVNGFMVDPVFSPDVAAGKKANDSIRFYDTQLEENNITRIEQMEFSFHIFSWDDMLDSGFDSDTISLEISYN